MSKKGASDRAPLFREGLEEGRHAKVIPSGRTEQVKNINHQRNQTRRLSVCELDVDFR
jgi:hypothetical protein